MIKAISKPSIEKSDLIEEDDTKFLRSSIETNLLTVQDLDIVCGSVLAQNRYNLWEVHNNH